jgi:hypothetical protein
MTNLTPAACLKVKGDTFFLPVPNDGVYLRNQEGVAEDLRLLHAVCKAEKKVFLPAMCLRQTGVAGLVVHPDSEGCWESAWRRVHTGQS